MNTNTIVGALLASLLSFLNALAALYLNDANFTLSTISEAALMSMVLGAVIQFVKDYQAISTRRMVNKLTGTGDGGGTV